MQLQEIIVLTLSLEISSFAQKNLLKLPRFKKETYDLLYCFIKQDSDLLDKVKKGIDKLIIDDDEEPFIR